MTSNSNKQPNAYKDSSQFQKRDTDADPQNMDKEQMRDHAKGKDGKQPE